MLTMYRNWRRQVPQRLTRVAFVDLLEKRAGVLAAASPTGSLNMRLVRSSSGWPTNLRWVRSWYRTTGRGAVDQWRARLRGCCRPSKRQSSPGFDPSATTPRSSLSAAVNVEDRERHQQVRDLNGFAADKRKPLPVGPDQEVGVSSRQ
jgi:hypothetical protein